MDGRFIRAGHAGSISRSHCGVLMDVSIAMATYNGAQYLPAQLTAWLDRQCYPPNSWSATINPAMQPWTWSRSLRGPHHSPWF